MIDVEVLVPELIMPEEDFYIIDSHFDDDDLFNVAVEPVSETMSPKLLAGLSKQPAGEVVPAEPVAGPSKALSEVDKPRPPEDK